MMRTKQLLAVAALALAFVAPQVIAKEVPANGKFDARIKHVTYNAQDVVQVVGHYGYSTHIEFAPNEKIENVALGDSVAWTVAPVGNHLFVKPTQPKAATNMTVLTDQRVYNFALTAKEATSVASRKLYFQVSFDYPQVKAKAKADALAQARALKAAMETKKLLDVAARQPKNWNYVGCGSPAVTPDLVWDDGRYTYMQFGANRSMPAVFVVDPADGKGESLVNTHVQNGVIVVHRTAQKFVLRHGQAVACVVNRAYNPRGEHDDTKTFSKNVYRTIKGGRP